MQQQHRKILRRLPPPQIRLAASLCTGLHIYILYCDDLALALQRGELRILPGGSLSADSRGGAVVFETVRRASFRRGTAFLSFILYQVDIARESFLLNLSTIVRSSLMWMIGTRRRKPRYSRSNERAYCVYTHVSITARSSFFLANRTLRGFSPNPIKLLFRTAARLSAGNSQ